MMRLLSSWVALSEQQCWTDERERRQLQRLGRARGAHLDDRGDAGGRAAHDMKDHHAAHPPCLRATTRFFGGRPYAASTRASVTTRNGMLRLRSTETALA